MGFRQKPIYLHTLCARGYETSLHCWSAAIALLQCWNFGWKQCDDFFRNLQPQLQNCPVTTCWQTLRGTWLLLYAGCMSGIVCWHLSSRLVGSWNTVPPCKVRSSLAVWGEHPCLCLYLSDLGRLSRESKFCHILYFMWSKEEEHSEVLF